MKTTNTLFVLIAQAALSACGGSCANPPDYTTPLGWSVFDHTGDVVRADVELLESLVIEKFGGEKYLTTTDGVIVFTNEKLKDDAPGWFWPRDMEIEVHVPKGTTCFSAEIFAHEFGHVWEWNRYKQIDNELHETVRWSDTIYPAVEAAARQFIGLTEQCFNYPSDLSVDIK